MDALLPGLSAAANSHPLFVHFPIAFWLGALLFWSLSLWRRSDDLFRLGRWLLYLGTLTALVAAATGWWAAEEIGHANPGHDFVHVHRNYMLVAFGLGVVTTIAAFAMRSRGDRGGRWVQLALLGATATVTVLGADRGVLLVFRYGVGTRVEAPAATRQGDGGGHGNSQSGHQHR